MNLISVDELQLSYGVQTIFKGVNFGIAENERVALVGHNGAGKSTLLNLIAQRMKPDDGKIVRSHDVTVGYLPQRVDYESGETVEDLIHRAVLRRKQAIEEHQEISNVLSQSTTTREESVQLIEKQSKLQSTIERLGGWNYQHEIDEMVDRLDLHHLLEQPLETLSGGQLRRVDLARVLLRTDDLLLLDEPTNHLDTSTVEWLESWLLGRSKGLLFVTHDRYFLERIATRILEISGTGDLYDHPGNYGVYMERKVERLSVQKKTEDRRQKLLKRELAWLRQGIKARGTRSKRRLADLRELQTGDPVYSPELQLDMQMSGGKSLGTTILEGFGLVKEIGGEKLLDQANFVLAKNDHVGIIGPNGCGKTTLIRLLMGEIPLDAGKIQHGERTEIAWMRQNLPALDPTKNVYDAFSDSDYVWVGKEKSHKREYLRNFLFDYELQRASCGTLSGGQRRRFELAKMVAKNANVLILDEPTNDLDLSSLQSLEEALENYSGCIIAISHDRYFLNRVCNRIIAFENGKLEAYEGNYDDYKEKYEELQRYVEERRSLDGKVEQESKSDDVKEELRGVGSGKREVVAKLTYAQRLMIPKLEKKIEDLEVEIEELEKQLADPELYTQRPNEIESINRTLIMKKEELDSAFEAWGELEELRGG